MERGRVVFYQILVSDKAPLRKWKKNVRDSLTLRGPHAHHDACGGNKNFKKETGAYE